MIAFLQALLDGVATGCVLALVAVGLSLVFRIGKFVNVAHADIATIGAYATLFGTTGLALAWPLAALGGVAVAALVGLACDRLVFRRLRGERSITIIVSSIGVAFFLRYLVTFLYGSNQLAFDLPLVRAIRLGDLRIPPYDIAIVALALSVFLALALTMRFTHFGRTLRATADNPDLARVAGLRSGRAMTIMWLLGSGLAGLGGILLGVKTVITPYLGWYLLVPAFAAMILGGIGSIGGTLAGAILISIVSELAATYGAPTYRLAAVFGIVILILMTRPDGLFGQKAVAK